MKKLLLLSLLTSTSLLSQTGLTTYPMPTGYTPQQVNSKTALIIDNAGNVWVGFKNNVGIGKFDGTNWTMYDTTNTPMTTANVTALGTQNGGIAWVGASLTATTCELFNFNGSSWADYSGAIDSSYVTAIFADNSANTLWIGTRSGLWKLNSSVWTHLTVANSGLASDTVLALAVDPSGNLLAGTQRGLSVQNGTGWTNHFTGPVQSVYSDAVNGVWLGSAVIAGKFAPPYFATLDSLFPTPVVNAYNANILSICRGPHGGVFIDGGTGVSEVFTDHVEFVYPPAVTLNIFTAYNPVNNSVYFVNRQGPTSANMLFAYDGTYAHHLGETFSGATPDNCKYLDVNNVRTAILNRGDKNWNLNNAEYEVPKNDHGHAHAVFASALWLGALDNGGALHQAAMTYRQNGMDYFPGPLDTINGTTDSATAVQYDYIWEITKIKIQEFQYYWSTGAVQNGTYIPDRDILSWPAHGSGNYTRNMAPFVDVNGDGMYSPLTAGDYPLIKGDEMLYCIYNDNLAAHTETGGLPLKVEVHASAYAYYCPTVADSQKVVNYTTYYDYQVFNRGGMSYDKAYIGLFHDIDLGAYNDDYVGCISSENFSYGSNGDANDGTSATPMPGTYGAHPPIVSIAVLNGPVADPGDGIDNDNDGTIDEAGEINLMTGFHYYNNDFTVTGNPSAADDYYMYMTGKWKDSTDVTVGGNGYGGTVTTQFMYDGLMYDTAAWTELSAGNTPFDRRSITSCGPFTLNAGQNINFNYAIVYSRDTTVGPDDAAYYDQAVTDVRRVRNWFNNNTTPSCVQWGVGINEPITAPSEMSLFPNPASTLLTIDYKAVSKNAKYQVLDLTGRVIESGTIMNGGQTTISVEELPAGIYLVRVVDNDHMLARKFIRQ